jgi:hypothetical protein
MRITLFAIIGVTLLATSTQALYDKSGPVLELTAQNFKEEVMNNGVSDKTRSFEFICSSKD